MNSTNKKTILKKAAHLFALQGYEGFSMRLLAKDIPITTSVLYHHFADKDTLLKSMYESLNKELGEKRAALVRPETAAAMLKQRIEFQIDNEEEIVAVLKYYLTYRKHFKRFKDGFVPDKSALHIEEVLNYGIETGEFFVTLVEEDAKVIAHAINGFLLEYYPHKPKGEERERLVERIYRFILRGLRSEKLLYTI